MTQEGDVVLITGKWRRWYFKFAPFFSLFQVHGVARALFGASLVPFFSVPYHMRNGCILHMKILENTHFTMNGVKRKKNWKLTQIFHDAISTSECSNRSIHIVDDGLLVLFRLDNTIHSTASSRCLPHSFTLIKFFRMTRTISLSRSNIGECASHFKRRNGF